MEYMKEPATVSQGHILCCQCGIAIPPNPANMCVACLRTQVDITEGIPKQVTVHFCKQCERYLQPPGTWVQCALESRELLTLCLKKIKASLSKVRLIDAGFVWTEPHSKRLKVKLTVQKEVMNGAILQQVFIVEYIVQSQMCDDCHRVEAKDFWKAVVQIRQKTLHKKTFFYLEQLILKHRLHQNTLRIKEIHDGLDFYYSSKQHAQKMVDFLQCTVPFAEIDGNTYWRHPFNSLFQPKQLEEFIVMDISRIRERKQSAGAGMLSTRHTLAEAWVQKTSELNTDHQYFCRTHLGHLLNPGDLVLGFDLVNCNLNDEFANKMNPQNIPDVILIKKSYDRTKRQRRRNWKLKELERDREGMDTDDERQYQDFLEDLEEDETIRKNVNIYKNSVIPVESDTDDEGIPRISLAEMLEDLQISQDATGGEGADMLTE
ncbi:60S ribosomal export protein NMD3 [Sceloporus undulatus]|uniref:60S ribosomal export protein NMD3 n=1 Tax=Sceloporus undulatus TaxID=8520 RepID=UPI001C4AEA77|nr:60S ribosomal export protein NMD3 [Sceloporus undulatus]